MSSDYLIAVDGGGTSCKVRITDQDGNTLGEGQAGPANIATNENLALSNIEAACINAAQQANLSTSALQTSHAVLGLAGANVSNHAENLACKFQFQTSNIYSDGEIALQGALGDSDGVVAIIGTGSVFFCRQKNKISHCGGWGLLLGDQAGGAWLGRSLLEKALLAMDGIEPHSNLTEEIAESFDHQQSNIVAGVVHSTNEGTQGQWTPAQLGSFAPAVTDAAHSGDKIALELCESAALYIDRSIDQLCNDKNVPVCLLGSLGPVYEQWLSEHNKKRIQPPEADALDGAIQIAKRTRP